MSVLGMGTAILEFLNSDEYTANTKLIALVSNPIDLFAVAAVSKLSL